MSDIKAGQIIDKVTDVAYKNANIVIALISTAYLNSDYCIQYQKRAVNDNKEFIPILVSDCLHEIDDILINRNLLPQLNGVVKAISKWQDKNEVYKLVSLYILRLIQAQNK